MLTPAIFNDLDKRDQADLIQQEAIYLGTRELPEFIVDLYSLEGFFVELFYHHLHDDLILIKGIFDFDPQLYPRNILGSQLKVA